MDGIVEIRVSQADLEKIAKHLIPSGIVHVTIIGHNGAVEDIPAELHIPAEHYPFL